MGGKEDLGNPAVKFRDVFSAKDRIAPTAPKTKAMSSGRTRNPPRMA
jgi:hypothetical protein